MDRLRPPPTLLPWRALLACVGAAGLALATAGGSWLDFVKLIGGYLPVGHENEGIYRALLFRSARTLSLIAASVVIGLSLAMAVTLIIAPAGRRMGRFFGWLGRGLASVPPMVWPLLTLWLALSCWNLPIESLFPYTPSPDRDSWQLRLGRDVWWFLVPALTLAIPVFASSLYTLSYQWHAKWQDPLVLSIRARGLRRKEILYRHLIPQLHQRLLWFSNPVFMLLLLCALLVEETLNFPGWGAFCARALRERDGHSLAAALLAAGLMAAFWFSLIGLLHKGRYAAARPTESAPEQARHRLSAILGLLLAAVLCTPPKWLGLPAIAQAPYDASFREIAQALGVATSVWLLVSLVAILIFLVRRWRPLPAGGIISTLATAPLLLCWLAMAALLGVEWRILLGLVLGLALLDASAFRHACRDLQQMPFITASYMLGATPGKFWRWHGLRFFLPWLAAAFLNTAAVAILWHNFLGWFGLGVSSTPSWGNLIAAQAANPLDAPIQLLVLAAWPTLWCLSFRLMSRGFSSETRHVVS